MGDEYAGEGHVEHGAIQIKGVAKGQHEADDFFVAAEAFQLLGEFGEGGFAAGGGEGDEEGFLDAFDEGEDAGADQQEAGGNQQAPEQDQTEEELGHKYGVGAQDAEAIGGYDDADGGEDGEGREIHDVARQFEHDVAHGIHGFYYGVGLFAYAGGGHAEEEGEDYDLEDFVIGQGLEYAFGEDVGDEVFEGHFGGFEAGIDTGLRQRQIHGEAGLEEVDEDHAEEQGYERGANEPEHGFAADAAHGAYIAQFGYAHHEGREHQGGDDHFDEVEEYGGDDGDFGGDGGQPCLVHTGMMEDGACHDAEDHGDDDI